MAVNSAMIAANSARWAKAKLTRAAEMIPVARRLVAVKARYQAVSAHTGVPWYVIAVIHERESSQRWDRSLAQGDPWNTVSTHVPKGRGPFKSWEEAAADALVVCPPYAAAWKDWTPGGTLTLLEMYNGLGYSYKGLPSPYVWSGTDQYVRGKYIADGVFDPNVVDKQLGCAGLIMTMATLDTSVVMTVDNTKPTPAPPPQKPPSKPAQAAGFLALLAAACVAVWQFAGSHPIPTFIGVAAVVGAVVYFIKRKAQ